MHHNARPSVAALIAPSKRKGKGSNEVEGGKEDLNDCDGDTQHQNLKMNAYSCSCSGTTARTGAPPLHQLSTALQRSLSLSLSVCFSPSLCASLTPSPSVCLYLCVSLFLPPCLSRSSRLSLSLVCMRRVTSLIPSTVNRH